MIVILSRKIKKKICSNHIIILSKTRFKITYTAFRNLIRTFRVKKCSNFHMYIRVTNAVSDTLVVQNIDFFFQSLCTTFKKNTCKKWLQTGKNDIKC